MEITRARQVRDICYRTVASIFVALDSILINFINFGMIELRILEYITCICVCASTPTQLAPKITSERMIYS